MLLVGRAAVVRPGSAAGCVGFAVGLEQQQLQLVKVNSNAQLINLAVLLLGMAAACCPVPCTATGT